MERRETFTIMIFTALLMLPGKDAQALFVQSDFTTGTAPQGPYAEVQIDVSSFDRRTSGSPPGLGQRAETDSVVSTDMFTIAYLMESVPYRSQVRPNLRGLTERANQAKMLTNISIVRVPGGVEAGSTFVNVLLSSGRPASELQPLPSMSSDREPWMNNSLYDPRYPYNFAYFESLGFWGPSVGLWYPSYGFWYFSNGLWDPSGLWYVLFAAPYRQIPGYFASNRKEVVPAAVPEPATLVLFGSCILILLLRKKDRRRLANIDELVSKNAGFHILKDIIHQPT